MYASLFAVASIVSKGAREWARNSWIVDVARGNTIHKNRFRSVGRALKDEG